MSAPNDREQPPSRTAPLTPGLRLFAALVVIAATGAALVLGWRRSHAATDESARRVG
jgi:hypothetical protein